MKNKNIEQMIDPLLDWYKNNKRDLPWRQTIDPYQIWVSEIMLQQTRVEAVIPYFKKFIENIPSLDALSQIKEERLLKLWEGLGYYSRVKNMQKCAKQLISEDLHSLPSSYLELLKLPGIGPYTAGAIASIAFGERVSAVDGNVLRVISRVIASHKNISDAKVKKEIELLLNEYIPKESGDFNQSLMELGATICIPSHPRCNICPIQNLCIAYQKKEMYLLPIKEKRKTQKEIEMTIFLFYYKGKIAIKKRKNTGILASLFEFPNSQNSFDLNKIPYSFEKVLKTPLYKHIFTHQIWHMKGFIIFLTEKPKDSFIWASLEQLENNYSLPTAFKYFLNDLYKIKRVS